MTTLKVGEIQIPRQPEEAVARHGRPLREALALLTQAAPPDGAFAEDMEAVLDAVGPAPEPGDPRSAGPDSLSHEPS